MALLLFVSQLNEFEMMPAGHHRWFRVKTRVAAERMLDS
jgi:hypothetical protein